VSPYRLASHLVVAFGLYTGLLWTSLSVIWPRQELHNIEWARGAARVKSIALPAAVLIGLTAASGAFVAGNDAVSFSYYIFSSYVCKFLRRSVAGESFLAS
jgi:cytochrome c oxidase assembly protein subunit 15